TSTNRANWCRPSRCWGCSGRTTVGWTECVALSFPKKTSCGQWRLPDRFRGGPIFASIRLPGGILPCRFCPCPVRPQNHIHFTGLGPAWDEFYRHSGGGKSLAGRELHFQRRGRLERDECAAARL